MKECTYCRKIKGPYEFFRFKSDNGELSSKCKECIRKINHIRKRKNKEYLYSFKIKCLLCEEKETVCLDFHHVCKDTKEFHISRNDVASRDRINKELLKCVVLCANCHRKVEYGSMKNYKFY